MKIILASILTLYLSMAKGKNIEVICDYENHGRSGGFCSMILLCKEGCFVSH